MGDAITTPFDVFAYLMVFVGIPMLIFGMPIIVLGFLSARRTHQLNRKRQSEVWEHAPQGIKARIDTSRRWPWYVALLLLIVTTTTVYLLFAAPLSRLFVM